MKSYIYIYKISVAIIILKILMKYMFNRKFAVDPFHFHPKLTLLLLFIYLFKDNDNK